MKGFMVTSLKIDLRITNKSKGKSTLNVTFSQGGFDTRDSAYRKAAEYIYSLLLVEGCFKVQRFPDAFNFLVLSNRSGGYHKMTKTNINGQVMKQPGATGNFHYEDYSGVVMDCFISTFVRKVYCVDSEDM